MLGFHVPLEAVRAAVAAQKELLAANWPSELLSHAACTPQYAVSVSTKHPDAMPQLSLWSATATACLEQDVYTGALSTSVSNALGGLFSSRSKRWMWWIPGLADCLVLSGQDMQAPVSHASASSTQTELPIAEWSHKQRSLPRALRTSLLQMQTNLCQAATGNFAKACHFRALPWVAQPLSRPSCSARQSCLIRLLLRMPARCCTGA